MVGLGVDPAMLSVPRGQVPRTPLLRADMRRFALLASPSRASWPSGKLGESSNLAVRKMLDAVEAYPTISTVSL